MVAVHPLWRPFEQPDESQIRVARVNPDNTGQWIRAVEVVAPDPSWPYQFVQVADAIREALGDRAQEVEHVGSTSVPGLAAKPVIDVDLTVPDSADEATYVPQLEAAGFKLVIREPGWEQHRAFTWEVVRANVHVFSPAAVEPRRHLSFRDWLRSHPEDSRAYGSLKADLAQRGFTDVMLYNNAKSRFIYDLYERIFAADPNHPHDPQPAEASP